MSLRIDKVVPGNIVFHDHPHSDIITVSTRSVILASTPSEAGQLAYANDSNQFFVYNGSSWQVAPLELKAVTSTLDMGAFNQDGLGVSDRSGYYHDTITDKILNNIRILENDRDEEGAIRTTTNGIFQVYLNGIWNDVVINFILREDSSGSYEFEHAPVGFDLYYELMSGNSDITGVDGKPVVQQYTTSMGAYQVNLQIDGGTF